MPINVLAQHDFKPKTLDDLAKRFRGKLAVDSDTFDRISREQKAKAFRIATVHKVQLVQKARDLVADALETGTPFSEFRAKLLALFDRQGVAPPALHRLQLAFRQNLLQSYSDARRETLDDPEISSVFRFRRYSTVGNGVPGTNRVRADHAILHGKVFRWNDPFWNTFTPPWDFGCRCTMQALTAGQVRRGRMTVWTLKGGVIVPAATRNAKGKQKGIKLKRNPNFVGSVLDFGTKSLDKDLRELVEELTK